MKKHLAAVMAFSAIAAVASAQETVLDDFETGVTGWAHDGGFSTMSHDGADGANGTTGSMVFSDNGFSGNGEKIYTGIVPEAGSYKVTFFYKNGQANNPNSNLTVKLNEGNAVNLGSSVVTEWTAAETGVALNLAAGADVQINIEAANGLEDVYLSKFDEFKLVKLSTTPILVSVTPLSTQLVAGTTTITAAVEGGSGTFTQATFDIGNDGSIEHTDNTPGDGFTFEWDTTGEADGAIDVKVVVTDDAASTGEKVVSYTIDNAAGRIVQFSSDFETWVSGLPVGWTRVDWDNGGDVNPVNSGPTDGVVTQETTDPFEGASALKLSYATNPDPYRYCLVSDSFIGNYDKYQITGAMKGTSYTRLRYFRSDDNATWLTSSLFTPGASAAWGHYVSAPFTPDPKPNFLAIATHFYSTGDGYWDAIEVTSSDEPVTPTDAKNWDLYY